MQNQKLRFTDVQKSSFFSTVTKRVNNYFKQNNISKHANGEMIFKTVFFLTGIVVAYGMIISGQFGLWTMLLLSIIIGALSAFIGFNVCHDAIHGAYSSNKWVNKSLGLIFNLIGANAYVWSITHNKIHHTYTNIPDHDEDIEVAPGLIRLSPLDEHKPHMKYQHYYAFFLYGLASLSWVLRKDYVKFFQKKIGQFDNTKHPKIEYFNLFFFKAVYYTLMIVLPLTLLDITWWQFLIGFLALHMTKGFILGLVFQLAHVVEGTHFPFPDIEGNIKESWAVHQMNTTANFARKNILANILCGGLNFQIEHHLFPNICHVHYTKISEIVKMTAEEHGIPYIESETFIGALKSHYHMLKQFGRKPMEVVAA